MLRPSYLCSAATTTAADAAADDDAPSASGGGGFAARSRVTRSAADVAGLASIGRAGTPGAARARRTLSTPPPPSNAAHTAATSGRGVRRAARARLEEPRARRRRRRRRRRAARAPSAGRTDASRRCRRRAAARCGRAARLHAARARKHAASFGLSSLGAGAVVGGRERDARTPAALSGAGCTRSRWRPPPRRARQRGGARVAQPAVHAAPLCTRRARRLKDGVDNRAVRQPERPRRPTPGGAVAALLRVFVGASRYASASTQSGDAFMASAARKVLRRIVSGEPRARRLERVERLRDVRVRQRRGGVRQHGERVVRPRAARGRMDGAGGGAGAAAGAECARRQRRRGAGEASSTSVSSSLKAAAAARRGAAAAGAQLDFRQ